MHKVVFRFCNVADYKIDMRRAFLFDYMSKGGILYEEDYFG